ncbi:N-6 DNA methylase [Streptococcus pneumoniae]|nr:N-6 DNA methylase [Streptococcus pneumoniae]
MKENNMLVNWKLESDVNDYVKKRFENLGLKKLQDY